MKSSAALAATGLSVQGARGLVPPVVKACFLKEWKYLVRSGAFLFSLIMPVFMVLVFGSRMYSLGRGAGAGLAFPLACAYLQMFMVAMLYNCFAADGAGVQMYFFAPIQMRDVLLAKNMLSTAILGIEVVLIYIAVWVASSRPSLPMTVMTLSWVVFIFLVGLSCGNLRSLYAPKKMEESGMKGMKTLPAMSSLISLGVLIVPFLLGWTAILLARHYGGAIYWAATGGFIVLIGAAIFAYLLVLSRVDTVAAEKRENLAAELCRT